MIAVGIVGTSVIGQEIAQAITADRTTHKVHHSKECFLMQPFVKNLVPYKSVDNWGRMQEVWLDK